MTGVFVKIGHLRLHIPMLVSCLLLSQTLFAGPQDTNTVSIVTDDYEFRGPDRISAGLTTIHLFNQGKTLHHVQLVKLPHGKTVADFNMELKVNPSSLPAWIGYVGGPNAVIPGEKTSATVNLEAGDYLLLCLIPNEKGVPHLALGMLKPVQVQASSKRESIEPTANVTITLLDFAFGMSRPIPSGSPAIHVMNQGKLPHEVVVVQLTSDTSISDFAKFAEKPSGPPPGKPIGGMAGLSSGGHGLFSATFAPGRYGLICFFPDPETSAPHFVRGMMSEFTVE